MRVGNQRSFLRPWTTAWLPRPRQLLPDACQRMADWEKDRGTGAWAILEENGDLTPAEMRAHVNTSLILKVSSYTGLLAHPQFSQTHSCLKGLPLLLPLLRKFIQFSLLTSSSLCSNVTFWEATRKLWQLASSTPIPLTLLYFTPEHLTPLAMVHVYSITAPAESESMRQEELVLFFIATPMPGW